MLLLVVKDNGAGFHQPSSNGTRFGRLLMTTLAEQLGGKLEQNSSPTGTAISVQFPLQQMAHTHS